MNHRHVSPLAGLAMFVVFAGCSSAAAPDADPVARRLAIIDDVATQMEALLNARSDATTADLQALLAARPEFVETGVEEEGAWGRFDDGRLFVLLDDRVSALRSSGTLRTNEFSDIDTPPYELPTNDRVQILDSMGTLFTPYWQDFKPWFDQAAYLTSVGRGSVEEFKNLSGRGVIYINAHAGRLKASNGSRIFAVTTATPLAPAFDLLYAQDLNDLSLVYAATKNDVLPNGKVSIARVYAFSQNFVRKYMQLQPDSLVVVDACRSTSPEIMSAFIEQGASLYAGWSNKVDDAFSQQAVKFFFDRMLGANGFLPESPPQRSFNYLEVLGDMARRGIDQTSFPRVGTTTFQVVPASATTVALLAPSIKNMRLHSGTNQLLLNGTFGSLQGKVKINGNEIACTDWWSDALICQSAPSGVTGVGKVLVETNGTLSNPRYLTEWKGTITVTAKVGCGPASPRSLEATLRLGIRLRADVGGFREHSGMSPVIEPVDFAIEPDSTNFTHASGTCSYSWPGLGTDTTRWSGGGQVPWDAMRAGTADNVGVIDRPQRRIRMHLEVDSGSTFQYATTCDGTLCAEGSTQVGWMTGDDGFKDGDHPWAGPVFDIALDENWNGIAGSKQGPAPADYQLPQISLTWTALSVSNPPDPASAQ